MHSELCIPLIGVGNDIQIGAGATPTRRSMDGPLKPHGEYYVQQGMRDAGKGESQDSLVLPDSTVEMQDHVR